MTPIPFREQNITYNPPEGMEDKCGFPGRGTGDLLLASYIMGAHQAPADRAAVVLGDRQWTAAYLAGRGLPVHS